MFQELIPEFVPPLQTSITIDPVYTSHQWVDIVSMNMLYIYIYIDVVVKQY